ncbi:MFS transporter [Cryomorphaceae bacterium 1068]|nr:MFS transporter [Cryomorphaceae bacterium 1068]
MQMAEGALNSAITKDDEKTINGWAMYDWANSVYSLVITSSIFPIFFENNTTSEVELLGRTFKNTALYSYTLSASFLIVALISPLLSGIADYSGQKKRFMQFFCYLGGLACVGLFFFDANFLGFGLLMTMMAGIGYSGSQVFYNAYLPEIASIGRQDSVSAKGFSLGYIGSIILLIVNLFMIMNPEVFGFSDGDMPARVSFAMVGIWWIGFAQVTFSRLPGNVYGKKVKGEYLYRGYVELRKVWNELKKTTRLKRYLISFFVFNMGVQTVMYMAVGFAKNEIAGMPDEGLIISILIIQFIAIIGAYFHSWLSSKYGNLKALLTAVTIWIGICVMAFKITTPVEFYVLAGIVGFVMGGIQALSRSTYSKFLPQTTLDHASYFSFYDVSDKIGTVVGTLAFGLIFELTGNLRHSVLAIGAIFVVGIIFLLAVPKEESIQS